MSFSVLAQPRLRINPLTLALTSKEDVTVSCTADVPDTGHPDVEKGVLFKWWEGDQLITGADSEFSRVTFSVQCS